MGVFRVTNVSVEIGPDRERFQRGMSRTGTILLEGIKVAIQSYTLAIRWWSIQIDYGTTYGLILKTDRNQGLQG